MEGHPDGTWDTKKIPSVDVIGRQSVSWAPAVPAGSFVSERGPGQPTKWLAVAGCDNSIKIYAYVSDVWALEHKLVAHSGRVLDVAWASNIGLPKNTIASAGQDGKVLVWKERCKAWWDKVLMKDKRQQTCCVGREQPCHALEGILSREMATHHKVTMSTCKCQLPGFVKLRGWDWQLMHTVCVAPLSPAVEMC
ncbi:unnamed protein product [Ostreobium quekettii]|uniref:Protein SEC13 homolog n=1 Tax=Ostreobium quekettii TaxID=121088 RepID=A0A8S1IPL2_9CHLO|nr:unnamed protein product [Ostreobium quekettii]|eukprot:evm.model.scf_74.2 EVM.evm.TU.scf_74.2   scf_74:10815-13453(-)